MRLLLLHFLLLNAQLTDATVLLSVARTLCSGLCSRHAGIFFVLPCIESYTKVDLRTVSFDVPPQEVLTKDSVTVSVDAVVYYRVSNATVSVANVEVRIPSCAVRLPSRIPSAWLPLYSYELLRCSSRDEMRVILV